MKQEYTLIIVVGLMILAYVLDAVTPPLSIKLASPYNFFDPQIMYKYSFTTTSIVIKSIALFLATLRIISLLELNKLVKGSILLVISALLQLYALQDILTNARVLSLEWSLALTLTGVALLVPTIIFILAGLAGKAHKSITKDPYYIPDESNTDNSDEL